MFREQQANNKLILVVNITVLEHQDHLCHWSKSEQVYMLMQSCASLYKPPVYLESYAKLVNPQCAFYVNLVNLQCALNPM